MTLQKKLKRSAQHRDYYRRNRDTILARKRAYYIANRNRIIIAVAAYKRGGQLEVQSCV